MAGVKGMHRKRLKAGSKKKVTAKKRVKKAKR